MASGIRQAGLSIDVKLEGIQKTLSALRNLEYSVTDVDLRNAVKYAIKPAEELARSKIPLGKKPHWVSSKGASWPVDPPFAVDNVMSRAKRFKQGGGAYAILGVRNPAFYAASFAEKFKPWLKSSFEATSAEQMERLKKWFERKLRRVVKGKR